MVQYALRFTFVAALIGMSQNLVGPKTSWSAELSSEVSAWIDRKYSQSEKKRAALKQLAVDTQVLLCSGEDKSGATAAARQVLDSIECLHLVMPDRSEVMEVTSELNRLLMKDPQSVKNPGSKNGSSIALGLADSGDAKSRPKAAGPESKCRFDLKKMKN